MVDSPVKRKQPDYSLLGAVSSSTGGGSATPNTPTMSTNFFFQNHPAIVFTISNAQNVNDKYTIYTLQMQTQLMTWDVDKRYSEFHNLHQLLQKKRTTRNQSSMVSQLLPKFPPKKLQSLKDQVIEERKEALAKYMNELLIFFNIFSDQDVCNFIAMKDKDLMRKHFKNLCDYQENMSKLGGIGHKISDVSEKSGGATSEENLLAQGNLIGNKSPVKASSSNLKASFSAQNPKSQSNIKCEQKVLELLDALEHDIDKFSNNLKTFEEYFFETKPALSMNYIKRLLFGDGYKQRGLFQHLRDCDPQTISSMNLINFFGRLLDYRRNHQIEMFRQVYFQCDLKFVTDLKLDRHIKYASSKDSAIQVINEYLSVNPSIPPSKLLNTIENEMQYERWKKQKQTVQKSYQNNSSTSPNLVRANSSNQQAPQLKKQSSFLIEKNKSMLDLSMELGGEEGMSDNGGNNKGSFLLQGNSNRLTTNSRGLTKLKSSHLLGDRGRGSSQLGNIPQGGFRGLIINQQKAQIQSPTPQGPQQVQNPFGFGLTKSKSQFHPVNQPLQGRSREVSSNLGDEELLQDEEDDYDDQWDEKLRSKIQNQMNNKKGLQAAGINIRKVTADFNNYFIESKQNKEKSPKEEEKKQTEFSQATEDIALQNRERRESYAAECESELKDLILNEIQKRVSRIFSVQFHNVEPEDIYGKIVSFKINQSLMNTTKEDCGLQLSNLVYIIENCKEQEEIVHDEFKIKIKERLTQHNLIVDFSYEHEEYFNSLSQLLLSYIEIGANAYISILPLIEDSSDQNHELGSSEAQQHLCHQQFVLLSQSLINPPDSLSSRQKAADAARIQNKNRWLQKGRLLSDNLQLQQHQNKQASFSNASTSNNTKSSGASLMNIHGSGASLMGLSAVKGSGASLNNILTHSQESEAKKSAEERKTEDAVGVVDQDNQINTTNSNDLRQDTFPNIINTDVNELAQSVIEENHSQEQDTSDNEDHQDKKLEIIPCHSCVAGKTQGNVNITLRIAEDDLLVQLTLKLLSKLEKQAILNQSSSQDQTSRNMKTAET